MEPGKRRLDPKCMYYLIQIQFDCAPDILSVLPQISPSTSKWPSVYIQCAHTEGGKTSTDSVENLT